MRVVPLALVLLALGAPAAVAQPVEVIHTFETTPHAPVGGLVEAPDGSLFGTTSAGGGGGTVYRMPPGGGAITIVHRFEAGASPASALARGRDGFLYGTTRGGGADGRGTVFRIDPATGRVSRLHAFDGPTGIAGPTGPVVHASDGFLYGTTEFPSGGVIYQIDPRTGRMVQRHRFAAAQNEYDRSVPVAGLAEGPDGRLYGSARGRYSYVGVVYRFDPATGALAGLGAPTSNPNATPTITRDGWLYGSMQRGNITGSPLGGFFRIELATGRLENIVLEATPFGAAPGAFTRLVEAADGSLHGTSFENRVTQPHSCAVFRLERLPEGRHRLVVVQPFLWPYLADLPAADLLLASDGRIYGAMGVGGPGNGGVLFRFSPGPSAAFTWVYSFAAAGGPLVVPPPPPPPSVFPPPPGWMPSGPAGWRPTAALVRGPDGALYGLTNSGGLNGIGDAFRLDPSTGLATFVGALPTIDSCCGEPAWTSALTDGGDGSLYAIQAVDPYSAGPIVRVTPATGAISIVTPAAFGSVSAGLQAGPDGLYGLYEGAPGLELVRFNPVAINVRTVATVAPQAHRVDLRRSAFAAARDGRFYVMHTVGDASVSVPAILRGVLSRVDPVSGAVALLAELPGAEQAVAPAESADGTIYYAGGPATESPRVLALDPATLAPRPGWTLPGQGTVRSLNVAPDGALFVVVDTAVHVELYRCAAATSGPVLVHAWARDVIGQVTPLLLADNIFYGATTDGPNGGTIFRLAATGALPPFDGDGDGLANAWEDAFGLSAVATSGDDGADGDPDGDGLRNVTEQAIGQHPRGAFVRYFAEGSANAFFATQLALANPGLDPAHVLVRFQTDDGRFIRHPLLLPAMSRHTIDVGQLDGLATATFSVIVESDVALTVDRTMTWGATAYGSHAESGVAAPSTTWYFAEGSTSGDFALFYLLLNPQPVAVLATVRFLRPSGLPPIERQYVLQPGSRTTLVVDGVDPALASTDVSAVITAPAPIIAERAMYLSRPGQPFGAGHASAGVTAPALTWVIAEGATGAFFDLFLLLANPGAQPAAVSVDYLGPGGDVLTKVYTVPANGRRTIWVDDEELPAGSGLKPLANAAVSMIVRSTNGVPLIVERTMWWPGPEITPEFWYETHNSPGTTTTARRWALAGGDVGGPDGRETYVLIANTSATAGRVLVRLLFENGNTTGRYYDLPAASRTNVPISVDFPEAVPEGRVAVVVEDVSSAPLALAVEYASYASPDGVVWARGSSALATPLP